MQALIHNPKDFWAGLIFLSVGAAACWISADYERGSAGMMGPGYFPTTLGWLLVILGGVSVLRSLRARPEPTGRWALGRASLVLLAMVLFGLLVRGMGLAIAVVVLALVAGAAHPRFRWAPNVLLAAGLAGLCVLLFVVGLGLPMPALGTWFSR